MPQYGGFWVRFVAYIIDGIILYIANIVVSLAFGLSAFNAMEFNPEAQLSGGMAMTQVLVSLLLFVGGVLYFVLMESSSRQATLGKIAMGLVVTDEHGDRISFARALGRYFAKIISALILGIGFLMVGWTERKRGLHDMIAGTLVYKARSPDQVSTSSSIFE